MRTSFKATAKLRARRMELGLEQDQVALKAGCSHDLISKIERGTRRVTPTIAKGICRALRTTISEAIREGLLTS